MPPLGFTPDRSSATPPAHQLRDHVRAAIRSGELAPGSRLPTVRGLASALGLAPNTVASAYRDLEGLGLLEGRGRAGTFVALGADPAAAAAAAIAADAVTSLRALGLADPEIAGVLDRAAGTHAGMADAATGDASPAGASPSGELGIDAVDHLVLNCRDVAATARWYAHALGLRAETYDGDLTALAVGRMRIRLRPTGADDWFTAANEAPGALDVCFLTERPIGEIVAHWGRVDVPIAEGPVTQAGAVGTIESVYARDPDGNLIEVARYA